MQAVRRLVRAPQHTQRGVVQTLQPDGQTIDPGGQKIRRILLRAQGLGIGFQRDFRLGMQGKIPPDTIQHRMDEGWRQQTRRTAAEKDRFHRRLAEPIPPVGQLHQQRIGIGLQALGCARIDAATKGRGMKGAVRAPDTTEGNMNINQHGEP